MNFVQLDHNAGDKRLKAACLAEQIIDCDLLPRQLRDRDDATVLEYIIQHEFVMFTFDRNIHHEWGTILAGRSPGIVVMRQDDEVLQQINTRTAPRYLSEFKRVFPDWHTVPCRNSVLELTPTRILLYHTLSTTPKLTYAAEWRQGGWQSDLVAHLNANDRGQPI
jgi:hypothetical protein